MFGIEYHVRLAVAVLREIEHDVGRDEPLWMRHAFELQIQRTPRATVAAVGAHEPIRANLLRPFTRLHRRRHGIV